MQTLAACIPYPPKFCTQKQEKNNYSFMSEGVNTYSIWADPGVGQEIKSTTAEVYLSLSEGLKGWA